MADKKTFSKLKALEYIVIILSALVFIVAAGAFIAPQTEYGFDKPNFIFLAIITVIDVICFVTLKVLNHHAARRHKNITPDTQNN